MEKGIVLKISKTLKFVRGGCEVAPSAIRVEGKRSQLPIKTRKGKENIEI